jgi:hypothetical protein
VAEFLPFTLQSNAALTTLLALLVPLIIHLLSKSRGTLVPFAHVVFIKKRKQRPMRQIRLVQRILLFLRMMILLLATLILAHVFYLSQIEPAQRQILLSPDWLNHATSNEKRQIIKSLPEARVSLLTAPAQVLSAEQIMAWQPALQNGSISETNNVWAQVKAQLSELPIDTQVDVYTSNAASQFVGEKVKLGHNVQWHILALPSEPLVGLLNQVNIAVIYDSDRGEDLTYIQAALTALQKNTPLALSIQAIPFDAYGDGASLAQINAIVYLSSQAVPSGITTLVAHGSTLLMDAAEENIEGVWTASTGEDLALQLRGNRLGKPAELELSDSIYQGQQSLPQLLWQTDKQQALLTVQGLAQGQIFAFHSRFNPSWNNLVLQHPLPLQLAHWLLAQKSAQFMLQQARLSDEQIITYPSVSVSETSEKPQSLTPLLALMLLLFFVAERLLSEWQRPTHAEGR